jgi:putative ABC transport system permease protein
MRRFGWARTLASRMFAIGAARTERDLDDDHAAVRQARQTSSGLEQAKEQYRDAHAARWARDLGQDIRYAWRSLKRAPAFAIVAVVTLALGMGANAAMFSVLNTFLIRPLPYPQPDRLVRVFRTSIFSQSWPHSSANVLDYRDRNTVFDFVVPYNALRQSLTADGQAAEGLVGMSVTADFFPALGVPAAHGRWFTADEDKPGADQVAVLSEGFWRRRFGADPSIVGRALRLEGQPVTVVGVMPPGFEHQILWGPIDLWRPFAFTPEQRQARGNNYLQAFGRLKAGVSREQAGQAMVALQANMTKETGSNRNESLRLEPLLRSTSDDVSRRAMWLAFGLSGFVLLIACANLANLQLVRTAARVREHTVRAALGASRIRLLRQSLTESGVIACAGGLAGIVVALGVIEFVNRRLFVDLPLARVTLDVRVFAFTLACAVITGLLFGTVPALLASRANVNSALSDQPRGSTSGSHSTFRHALIVSEVAFALVLLTGAGLFLRGLQRFSDRDPGWRVDGLVTAQLGIRGLNPSQTRDQRGAAMRAFYQAFEQRVRALPGVVDVAISSSLPIGGFNSSGPLAVEGRPPLEQGRYPEVFAETVSLTYFNTLGIRLISGRLFDARDTADSPAVTVVNERLAKQFFPNESPLGKRVSRPPRPGTNPTWLEVVGVVNDVGFPGNLSEPYSRLESFIPLAQQPIQGMNITVRTTMAPEALTEPLRRVTTELMPASPLNRIRTARTLVNQNLGRTELLATLLGAFAVLGLALAAIGIYGVTSYSVAQRTGEIGIRMALGAEAGDVLRLILRKGSALVIFGVSIGAFGAYAVGQLLLSLIPTLPTRDPETPVTLAAVLVAIAMLACYLPARRASKLDPAVALRHD